MSIWAGMVVCTLFCGTLGRFQPRGSSKRPTHKDFPLTQKLKSDHVHKRFCADLTSTEDHQLQTVCPVNVVSSAALVSVIIPCEHAGQVARVPSSTSRQAACSCHSRSSGRVAHTPQSPAEPGTWPLHAQAFLCVSSLGSAWAAAGSISDLSVEASPAASVTATARVSGGPHPVCTGSRGGPPPKLHCPTCIC